MNETPTGPSWLRNAGRLYLDTSAVASPDGVDVVRQQVLPDARARGGAVRLVVYAASFMHFMQPQAGPRMTGQTQAAQQLIAPLREQTDIVDWQPVNDTPGGNAAADSIVKHCIDHRQVCDQILITQSDALATLVEQNGQSDGHDRLNDHTADRLSRSRPTDLDTGASKCPTVVAAGCADSR